MKISIITTFYNSVQLGNFVHRAMDCLLKQTYENIEFVCVNDGSQDETLMQLKTYAQKDNRIKIVDKLNEGVAQYAKAAGQDVASGDWIMLFDHDDLLSLDAIEKAVEVISTHKDLEGVSMQVNTLFSDGSLRSKHNLFQVNCDENFEYKEISGEYFYALTVGRYDIHFRGLIKAEKFKKVSFRYKEKLVNGDEIVERLIYKKLTKIGSCDGIYQHFIYQNSSAKSFSIKKTDISRTDVILRELFKIDNVYDSRKEIFEVNTYKTFLNSFKIYKKLNNHLNTEDKIFYSNRMHEAYQQLDKKIIINQYQGLYKIYHSILLSSYLMLNFIYSIKS